MSAVHPTLEAVARAIMETHSVVGNWEHYLLDAHAALNALIDCAESDECKYVLLATLREIAAEPETVESVLYSSIPGINRTSIDQIAVVLREKGLVT